MSSDDSGKRAREDEEEGEQMASKRRSQCWWSEAKSELYNLWELLQTMNDHKTDIPEGMYQAANLSEAKCRSTDPLKVKKCVEKRIAEVSKKLAETQREIQAAGSNPVAAEYREFPAYVCIGFLQGECPLTDSECGLEHLYPCGKYLPTRLRGPRPQAVPKREAWRMNGAGWE
eukprot:CAMPEP_0174374426 /NCGR_PEP_ID=MMETSP0811_2-20130205/110826_1 /TAXON_ID=73025 ORGANISM="Eutreptiella gymnastica-like, Strain CCMP1594" /NCGR_SAMPLE_ID=MMETSP0811_2 /ASSEMBLY_ACC=CAM_ASM_000667 /LENGTH=172 /DNA_ID=CAMNT_0015523723 /DNA_START=38 /DNA_END=553 /DNA_ORIENTATION=-